MYQARHGHVAPRCLMPEADDELARERYLDGLARIRSFISSFPLMAEACSVPALIHAAEFGNGIAKPIRKPLASMIDMDSIHVMAFSLAC